jgi:hypothetical protein
VGSHAGVRIREEFGVPNLEDVDNTGATLFKADREILEIKFEPREPVDAGYSALCLKLFVRRKGPDCLGRKILVLLKRVIIRPPTKTAHAAMAPGVVLFNPQRW